MGHNFAKAEDHVTKEQRTDAIYSIPCNDCDNKYIGQTERPAGRPAESHKELNDYLIITTDRLRNEHPDHGLVLPGDFNDFDCSKLVSYHSLKQVLQQPTRNSAILDLM